jgi:hypothetical protein
VRHCLSMFADDRLGGTHAARGDDHNSTTIWALRGASHDYGLARARSGDTAEIRVPVRVLGVVLEGSSRTIRRVTCGEQAGTSPENWPKAR